MKSFQEWWQNEDVSFFFVHDRDKLRSAWEASEKAILERVKAAIKRQYQSTEESEESEWSEEEQLARAICKCIEEDLGLDK